MLNKNIFVNNSAVIAGFFQVVLMCVTPAIHAQNASRNLFPFPGVNSVSATLNVNTNVREKANNRLLSVNIDWPAGVFNRKGYNHPKAKEFMGKFQPVSLRWPQGVWANFYDWEVDGRRRYDTYPHVTPTENYDDQIDNNQSLEYGYDGLKELHDAQQFDVLWTFNVTYDSWWKSRQRLNARLADGFPVSRIELGNEQFWASQRSYQVENEAEYVAYSKGLVNRLKQDHPGLDLRFSIPLSWRRAQNGGSIDHSAHNSLMVDDGSYFDAISLHRYVHSGRNVNPQTASHYTDILTAPTLIDSDVAFVQGFADKPIWLSEWGVSMGYQGSSYLGMADAYLYLFDNQDVFEYANWFQIHGTNKFFEQSIDASGGLITVKRGFGAVYEVLRGVIEDSDLLQSSMATEELVPGSDAVVGRAVVKDDEVAVILVNKTPEAVTLTLKFDGTTYNQWRKHEAITFSNLDADMPQMGFYGNVFDYVQSGNGTIVLPPYSINKLSNLSVNVAARAPYAGVIQLPGTIQAENYDLGGQNVAYFDTGSDNNLGTYLRDDGVDIGDRSGQGGHNVGWIEAGEWLEYTVNVANAGNHNFTFHYSGTRVGKVSAEFTDLNQLLFTDVDLQPTPNGWPDYQTRTKYQVTLPAGQHVLRITANQDGFNLDRIVVSIPASGLRPSGGGPTTIDEAPLRIHPNPTTDGRFRLSRAAHWEVYGISGKKLAAGRGFSVDLSPFPKGLYVLRSGGESYRVVYH